MIVYLNLTEFADHLGIARDTLAKYRLPEPDAMIGDRRGWMVSTIETWNEQRPGRGNWGPKVYADTPPPIRPGGMGTPAPVADGSVEYPEFAGPKFSG